MNKYFVITSGGFTQDDSGNDVENLQVIGTYLGYSEEEAIEKALEYIREAKMDFGEEDLTAHRLSEYSDWKI